jgi:hypothetical protein
METVNVILRTGATLDALTFDQMATAIANYNFDNPRVSGTLTISSLGKLVVASGGVLDCVAGSVAKFETVQTSGLATLNSLEVTNASSLASATASGTLGVTGLLTATGGVSLPSGADITGSAGSTVSVETLDTGSSGNVKAGDLSLYDRAASYSPTAGRLRWDGYSVMIGDGSKARALAAPIRGYDATFLATNAIGDTTAVVSVRLAPTAKVVIRMSWSAQVAIAAANCIYRLQVSGIYGTAEPDVYSYYLPNPALGFSFVRVFEWTPTDSFAALGPETYAFLVRLGRSGGNDLTATAISIEATRDTVV